MPHRKHMKYIFKTTEENVINNEMPSQVQDGQKINGWEKVFQANGTRKKASLSILVSDIIQCKPKLDRRNKEDH